MEAVQIFEYNGSQIEFDLSQKNIMINATEMAKPFDKKVEAFMRNEGTQGFIKSCLRSENSSFLGIKNETDLYVSKQKSGTWMHRVLALKFAAWLDADFEVWVYYTIEKIMFGTIREEKGSKDQRAERRKELDEILGKIPEYLERMKLDYDDKVSDKKIRRQINKQLNMF